MTPTASRAGSCWRGKRTRPCAWRCSSERPPAAGGASAGGVCGAAGDGGGPVPGLQDAVRHRRPSAVAGGVPRLRGRRAGPRGHRGTVPTGSSGVQRAVDPAFEALTTPIDVSVGDEKTLRAVAPVAPGRDPGHAVDLVAAHEPLPGGFCERPAGTAPGRAPRPGIMAAPDKKRTPTTSATPARGGWPTRTRRSMRPSRRPAAGPETSATRRLWRSAGAGQGERLTDGDRAVCRLPGPEVAAAQPGRTGWRSVQYARVRGESTWS